MSINFGQFPTPRLPVIATDVVVGYQLIGSVPTLAQYTMTQLFSGVFPGGVVPPSQGGTGLTTLTAHAVLLGEGISNVGFASPGAAGQMLLSTGLTTDPAFGNAATLIGATITASTIATTTVASTVTGVTGNGIENSTQLATDAFVNQQIIRFSANVPLNVAGGGIFNQAVTGTGVSFVIFVVGGTISSVVSVISGGTGYAVGDMLLVQGGNFDARVRITNVIGGVVQSGGISVLYGGTGYTTGATVQAADVPPGQRTIVLTGVLTSNITYILANGTFNNASRRPEFVNNTTGAFTVTVKISNGAGGSTGTGVVLPQGTNNSTALELMTDGSTDVWVANTPLGIGVPAYLTAPGPVGSVTPNTGAFTTLSASGNDALFYQTTNAQSFATGATNTVTTWTKVFDRVNTNFNAATGVFTAPVAGFYDVSAGVNFAANTGAIGTLASIGIVANGVTVANGFYIRQTATSTPMLPQVSALCQLAAGQTIVVQGTQNTGGTVALTATANANYLSIYRIP